MWVGDSCLADVGLVVGWSDFEICFCYADSVPVARFGVGFVCGGVCGGFLCVACPGVGSVFLMLGGFVGFLMGTLMVLWFVF